MISNYEEFAMTIPTTTTCTNYSINQNVVLESIVFLEELLSMFLGLLRDVGIYGVRSAPVKRNTTDQPRLTLQNSFVAPNNPTLFLALANALVDFIELTAVPSTGATRGASRGTRVAFVYIVAMSEYVHDSE